MQSGTILTHHLWLVRQENNVVATENLPWNENSIPCRADWMPSTFMPAEDIQRGMMDRDVRYETEMGGDKGDDVVGDDSLPGLGPMIVMLSNCQSTLGEIFLEVREMAEWVVDWNVFMEHAREWRVSLSKARAMHTLV